MSDRREPEMLSVGLGDVNEARMVKPAASYSSSNSDKSAKGGAGKAAGAFAAGVTRGAKPKFSRNTESPLKRCKLSPLVACMRATERRRVELQRIAAAASSNPHSGVSTAAAPGEASGGSDTVVEPSLGKAKLTAPAICGDAGKAAERTLGAVRGEAGGIALPCKR
jgi:hypothetical protein